MSVQSFPIGKPRGVKTTLRILSLVLIASALVGCNTYRAKETLDVPNDYRKRHQIGLREGTRSVEVFIGNSRGALNPTQRSEVLAFAQSWKTESTGGIVIDVPKGTPNQVAASEAVREINAILAASGMPPRTVVTRAYQPENSALLPTIRLNYPRIMAEAGPCGLWPADLGPGPELIYNENRPYWNLGCANQRNLAAMVAEPADLVQPRGEASVWRSRRTTVLEKYRVGQSPETTYPNPNNGTLSDVGR